MKSIRVQIVTAITIIFIIGMAFMFAGHVKMELGYNGFDISGTFTLSTTVSYSDIKSINYVEAFDIGKRDTGLGTLKMNLGTYSNGELGKYKLYSYSAVGAFVVVKYSNKVLVFNQSTVEDTERLYNELKFNVENE